MKDYIAEMLDGSRVKFSARDNREANLTAASIANSQPDWAVVSVYEASRQERVLKPIISWDEYSNTKRCA